VANVSADPKNKDKPEIVLIEVGGTVGDIESTNLCKFRHELL
jgi:CTP synthase (UTP-ammonia lyase)